MSKRFSQILITLVISADSAGYAATPTFPPYQKSRQRSEYTAEGQKYAAATAHPLASSAAMEMFRLGGNAADAATAASFVISVVRPQSTGIGGGGFLVYHDAKRRKNLVYDFRERAPAAASRDMYLDKDGNPKSVTFNGRTIPNASMNGHLSVGVPGLIKGIIAFHREHGKLPLPRVMQPAIYAAKFGFPVYEGLADAIEERKDILSAYPSSQKLFLPDGKPLKLGDKLIQADLAETLKDIAETGGDSFYKGKIAEKLIAEMQRGGGIITAADLLPYQVKMREPVIGSFKDYKVVSMPPPSSGGVHIVQMLNILAQYDLKQYPRFEAKTLHLIAEAMRRAFADRAELLGDPDFFKVPVKGIISLAYARKLAKSIRPDKASMSTEFTKSEAGSFESPSTTHLSVVDASGNAVASTQTINYSFGSCVVAEGTGIILNDEMDDFSIKPDVPNAYGLVGSEANAIAAGKTMLSSMSPTLVLDKRGKIHLVAGSPGGPRIISATFQTILNAIGYGMSLPDAVHALRIHHQWLPDKLRIEDGIDELAVAELKRLGHAVEKTDEIGDVHAIMRTKNGWVAVSDTRSEGQPMAK